MIILNRLFPAKVVLMILFLSGGVFTFAQTASHSIVSIDPAVCGSETGGTLVLNVKVTHNKSVYLGAFAITLNKDGVFYQTYNSYSIYSTDNANFTITGLPPGTYTTSGNASALSPTYTSLGYPSIGSLTFKLGNKVSWDEVKEMAVQSAPNSVLQNVTTPSQTYSAARGMNVVPANGWMMFRSIFNASNATARSIYYSLTNTAALVSFNPATQNGYVEFRKGGTVTTNSGEGVYVRFSSVVYKLSGVVLADRIRVERSGNSVTFYKDQLTTPLTAYRVSDNFLMSPFSVSQNVAMGNTFFATASGDGFADVVSSATCNSEAITFAELKYELDGSYHTFREGQIRFIFNQEYDAANLQFNLYNFRDELIKTQANFTAVPTTHGVNYLLINANPSSTCVGRGMYYLEVINSKKEKMYLRFYNETMVACANPGEPIEF